MENASSKTTHARHEIEIHEYNFLVMIRITNLPRAPSSPLSLAVAQMKKKLCHWNVNWKVSKKECYYYIYNF